MSRRYMWTPRTKTDLVDALASIWPKDREKLKKKTKKELMAIFKKRQHKHDDFQ